MPEPKRRGNGASIAWFLLGLLCGAALFILAAGTDPEAPFRFIYEAF